MGTSKKTWCPARQDNQANLGRTWPEIVYGRATPFGLQSPGNEPGFPLVMLPDYNCVLGLGRDAFIAARYHNEGHRKAVEG